MRSNTSISPARRTLRRDERRSSRRPAFVVGGLALTVLTTCGVVGAAPVSQADASGPALTSFSLASYSSPAFATAEATPAVAQETLSSAQATLDAAATLTADIQAAGLDLGTDPTIDTASLEAAVERLDDADDTVSAFLPDIASDVAAAGAPVDQRVSALRASLDAAKQRKAEEEAAEKARQEAEAAAAAATAAAAAAAAEEEAAAKPTTTAPTTGSVPAPPPVARTGNAAEAQAIARDMLAARGWGDDQFSCLVSLWNKESGWNSGALNRSSGAYGIPQALPGSKMASAGADWQTNPATQITWGLGYISGRYGNPCGAWSHSQSVGWY